jgi:hypothetical protein
MAFPHHLRFFRTDPVSDEAAVLFGFLVVRALMTNHVMSSDIVAS